ncbi:MAG: FAD-binding oxidoreductase [Sulfitobacter sp.]|nr:FAD-binding oxidoreductase [Sulfitobacter sp.]
MPYFPITLTSPVLYPGPPPREADVVVIGGGVIGICAALSLARSGLRVTLLEKGRIAGEQSSRNWGWIRQQGRDPAELPIMVEARRLWQELARKSNQDFGLRQGGVTYVARTAVQLETFERWLPHARTHGVDTKMLSAAEVAACLPGLEGKIAGAMVTPSDMRAEPWLAVPALATLAARAGVRIVENCAVRALDIVAGRVVGVVTEAGRVRAQRTVLAGGAWSALFLRRHGLDLPQLSVRESVLATQAMPQITEGAVAYGKVAFRRRMDGGYSLAPTGASELFIGPDAFRAATKYLPQLRASPFSQGYRPFAPEGFPDAWSTPRDWSEEDASPFEAMRILDPKPNMPALKRLIRRFGRLFPDMPPVRPRATWAGMIDTMPDVVPVVDHCAALPGLVIGTGMSGHGFGIGPGMGRVLAALVTGEPVGHDLTRFRADRFTGGSAIELGPSV